MTLKKTGEILVPVVIARLRATISDGNNIYPAVVKTIKAGYVNMKLDKTFPMITVRESFGNSHAVFPSVKATCFVTVWVKGDDTTPYKVLCADIGAKVNSRINKKNTEMTDAGNDIVMNLFVKTGGQPTWMENIQMWSCPLSYDVVYEEDPANNS